MPVLATKCPYWAHHQRRNEPLTRFGIFLMFSPSSASRWDAGRLLGGDTQGCACGCAAALALHLA